MPDQKDKPPLFDNWRQWYLLVAGGLLLAAETLLSNRLSQNGARVS